MASDRGGEIDSVEFQELMASLGVSLTPEQTKDKLKILDEDSNGTISKEEFIVWHVATMAAAANKKKQTVRLMGCMWVCMCVCHVCVFFFTNKNQFNNNEDLK